MDFALSELPFFPLLFLPEEPTLSQLPFFAQDSVENSFLPPRPSSVCDACWEGPFAMHLGLPLVSPRNGQRYRRWPEEISYSTTLRKVVFRAYAGCVWCQYVLRRGAGDYIYPDTSLIITVCGGSERLNVKFQWISVKINGDWDSKDAYVYTAFDDPAEPYFEVQNPSLDLEAPRFLYLARQYIDHCFHEHECCQSSVSPTSPRLLPKRLVDCTDLARPRLFSPTEEHAEYVALSYVWGEDQVHKTTTSNLSTYEHGIVPSLLPATIRDAIRLTHKLGFRALWVDSLCIVQDSDEDKLHEIGRMHHIYRCAHLTIIAASAERASEGFLYKRPPPEDDVALPFICPPRPPIPQMEYRDDPGHAVATSRIGQVYLSPWDPWDMDRRSYHHVLGCIATRSWCMQEYLMSTRSLIITTRTVLFRCRTVMRDVGGSREGIELDPRLPHALFLPVPPTAKPGSEEWRDMHNTWQDIMENYSERATSDESDKLVACAAMAELFHGVLRSDYLAGLWRSEALLADLLWKSALGPGGSTRPRAYRAPSWSWAAVEGPFAHFPWHVPPLEDTRNLALAEIMDCWVTLEDPALPFGRVTDGALVLRGIPIPCRGGPRAKDDYGCWSVPLPSFQEARRQQWGLCSLHSIEEDGEVKPTLTQGDPVALLYMDYHFDELPGRMWLVPFMTKAEPHCLSDVRSLHGIVLELAPSSNDSQSECEKTRFRRIGHLTNVFVAAKDEADLGHPLWEPLTRAVKNGECPWTDIVIV